MIPLPENLSNLCQLLGRQHVLLIQTDTDMSTLVLTLLLSLAYCIPGLAKACFMQRLVAEISFHRSEKCSQQLVIAFDKPTPTVW